MECVGGAELKDNYLRFISETGFEDVEILKAVPFIETDEGTEDYSSLLSLTVRRPLPAAVRESAKEWVECVGGAELKDNYLRFISETGFEDVEILKEVPFIETDEGTEDYSSLLSLTVRAYKPL